MVDVSEDIVLGETLATEPNDDNGGLPAGLPMPRDATALSDLSKRRRVTHFGERRYPFPVPNGWFVVATSAEIAPGEVRALHYFDRDLVLYRTDSGEPRVLDAHCPHLGAHLGYGGSVAGDRVGQRLPRSHGVVCNRLVHEVVHRVGGDAVELPREDLSARVHG